MRTIARSGSSFAPNSPRVISRMHWRGRPPAVVIGVMSVLAAYLGGSGSAYAGIIDFNSGTEGAAVGTIGNVTFINAIYASPGNPAVGFDRDTGPADTIATGTPTTFITEPVPIAGQNPKGITMAFATPVNSLAFELLDLDWKPGGYNERYTVTLLDSSNTSFVFQGLASDIFPSGTHGDGSVLPLSFSQTDIVQANILAEVVATGNRAGMGVDNVQFTSVPEPSCLGLVVVGMGLFRRRKCRPFPAMLKG